MNKVLLILLLSITPLFSIAQSGAAVEELLASLASIKHLQGKFTQRQYGLDTQLLAESSGTFSLLRPGYFSWEIRSPDRQLIIAGPEFIWHYDRDLETVTRRPVSGIDGGAPLQILGGDELVLREKFTVEQPSDGTFVLTPLSSHAGFKQLTLSLDRTQLTGMEIRDSLDQTLVIEFSEVDSDSILNSTDFAFSPPAEADLFYYDE